MKLRVGVLGAGGFGRAIAQCAARNEHDVLLWSRQNRTLPQPIKTSTQLEDIRDRELLFVAIPSHRVEEVASELSPFIDGSHLMVHVSRGLVGADLKPITTVLREGTACRRLGVLAGPLIADALAEGRPSGAIVGTEFPEVAAMVRTALAGESLRIYHTHDVLGVQMASATVGLLTVVLAYARELGTDPGTLAVLATRGIAEVSRIGEAFGAKQATFMGLAGLGDLIAAVAGDERPESQLGRALAQGVNLAQASREVGAYIEGIEVARKLMTTANRMGIETPITSAFVSLVDGEIDSSKAIRFLMERQVGEE